MNRSDTDNTSVFKRAFSYLLAIAIMVLLSACAGAPPARENLGIQISATADVNPDMQGRPSPIILYIMELSSTEQFSTLDYMSLTQPSGTALGSNMLSKNQMVLQPGESKPLPLELNPLTTAIGFVAGYRDIDNAVWRTSIAITQGTTKGINVTLGQQQIVTAVSD
jgi:type VI secretion system protein VasD